MGYFFRSLGTRAFWRYALLSPAGASRVFAAVGVTWTFIELLDFVGIYERANYGKLALFPILGVGILFAALRVRPVSRITYKVPSRDLTIEVRIGDLLDAVGAVVISSSTTFDTDIASGIISPNSLQGQFTGKYFSNNTAALDAALSDALAGVVGSTTQKTFGKTVEFPVGTVAPVSTHGNDYYFLAMSKFNAQQNAYSTPQMIEESLTSLWDFVRSRGELRPLSFPLLGTGRGRIGIPRKKMIELIAQSFVSYSTTNQIAPKLLIYIHPSDAENYEINLFEIRDYLSNSIHF
jgi:hypothetical protein